jgi:hypothetical protein
MFVEMMGIGRVARRTHYEQMVAAAMPVDDEIVVEETPLSCDDDDKRYGETVNGTGAGESWVMCPTCLASGKVESEGRTFRCNECKGKRGWWDDRSSIDAYGTTSGDTPVLLPELTKFSEDVPRNFWEVAPKKDFYSVAKYYPKAESNDEGLVCRAILEADKILNDEARMQRLTKLWKKFWERTFAWQECGQHWLSPRATRNLRLEFNRRGVFSVGDKMKMRSNARGVKSIAQQMSK